VYSSGGHVGFRKGKRNFVYVVAFTERVCSCMLKPPARRSFPNNGDRELSALTPGKNFKARVGFSRITITTQSNFILANFEITANVCRLHPTSDSFNWKLLQHVIQICSTLYNMQQCFFLVYYYVKRHFCLMYTSCSHYLLVASQNIF
jgi:hypothetical protein